MNMTMEVVNSGARPGVLEFLELLVTTPEGATERFEWCEFHRYVSAPYGVVTAKESDPRPVAVVGKSRRPLLVQFVQTPRSTNYTWLSGLSKVSIRGWCGRASRYYGANVKCSPCDFYLSREECERLNSDVASGLLYLPVRISAWA